MDASRRAGGPCANRTETFGNDLHGPNRVTAGAGRGARAGPWEGARMTPVGLFGILICIAGFYFARANVSKARLVLFILLLLVHVGASIAAYLYAQDFGSDATMYYYD